MLRTIKRILMSTLLTLAGFAVYSHAATRLNYVQLPSGATLGRGSIFSDVYSDIVLRRKDGAVVVDGNIDFVCFNERFVRGNTIEPFRFFIFEKGRDSALFEGDPGFKQTEVASGLLSRESGCGGIERQMLGYTILLKNRQYRMRWFD